LVIAQDCLSESAPFAPKMSIAIWISRWRIMPVVMVSDPHDWTIEKAIEEPFHRFHGNGDAFEEFE
jgi:hypothetical protein